MLISAYSEMSDLGLGTNISKFLNIYNMITYKMKRQLGKDTVLSSVSITTYHMNLKSNLSFRLTSAKTPLKNKI
jgi:hypothetical protein